LGGEKCRALAKHEYKLVLVNEIIVAMNCPQLQHADDIIKKTLRSISVIRIQSWTRVGISQNIEENISNVAVNVPFVCYYDKIYLFGT
jgi:hypothetical protein